jgi:hypothetical protein
MIAQSLKNLVPKWEDERAAYERLLERLKSRDTQFRGNEEGSMTDTTVVNVEDVKRRIAELNERLASARNANPSL